MADFFKDLRDADNEEIIIVFLVVTFIVLLIIYLISIFSCHDTPRHSSYIGAGKKQGRTRYGYYEPHKTQQPSEGGSDNVTNNHVTNSSQFHNEHDNICNYKLGSDITPNNGCESIIDGRLGNSDGIKNIKNEDGTIRTEIDFDSTYEVPTPASVLPEYNYLETANNCQFRKLFSSDEKCFFRTWEENGIRKFEFHGNVEKALANLNAIFDDVCEIEGKQNGATNISNIEPGILDSQLKIEKKAKIRLT